MDVFESSLNDVLADTFNSILKYEEAALKSAIKYPVTITEMHMIEAVGKLENKETTVSTIASLLGISMPTATVAVKKLESKGFIKKIPCETDGRRMIISLTETGRKIDRLHRLFHEKMIRNISSKFADEEKEALLKAIITLNQFFKQRTVTEL